MASEPNIAFIGSGNAATQLAKLFHAAGQGPAFIYSRTVNSAKVLASQVNAKVCNALAELPKDATVFLCVPDSEISAFSAKLPSSNTLVHCSGSVSLEALQPEIRSCGVFYPLQTLSRQRPLSANDVPIFLEASDKVTMARLQDLAAESGLLSTPLDSIKRKKLHLAAVMVNNFSNHLWAEAGSYLSQNDLPKQWLEPLLMETLEKFKALGAETAQTGPARRGDDKTISDHLSMLKDQPSLQQLYKALSLGIKDRFKA